MVGLMERELQSRKDPVYKRRVTLALARLALQTPAIRSQALAITASLLDGKAESTEAVEPAELVYGNALWLVKALLSPSAERFRLLNQMISGSWSTLVSILRAVVPGPDETPTAEHLTLLFSVMRDASKYDDVRREAMEALARLAEVPELGAAVRELSGGSRDKYDVLLVSRLSQ